MAVGQHLLLPMAKARNTEMQTETDTEMETMPHGGARPAEAIVRAPKAFD